MVKILLYCLSQEKLSCIQHSLNIEKTCNLNTCKRKLSFLSTSSRLAKLQICGAEMEDPFEWHDDVIMEAPTL